MTLQIFTRDIIPVLQLVVTSVGLASVLLLWHQIRSTQKWNRLDATFKSLDIHEFSRVESEALTAAKSIGINLTNAISEQEATKIRADHDVLLKVKALIIFLDKQSVALLSGYLDEVSFVQTYGRLICGYSRTLKNYVLVTRRETCDEKVYFELEHAAQVIEALLRRH